MFYADSHNRSISLFEQSLQASAGAACAACGRVMFPLVWRVEVLTAHCSLLSTTVLLLTRKGGHYRTCYYCISLLVSPHGDWWNNACFLHRALAKGGVGAT